MEMKPFESKTIPELLKAVEDIIALEKDDDGDAVRIAYLEAKIKILKRVQELQEAG